MSHYNPSDSDRIHTVESNDSVWSISAQLAHEVYGEEATLKTINDEKNAITLRNGLDKNGRNPDFIYPTENLVIPALPSSERDAGNTASDLVRIPSLTVNKDADRTDTLEYPRNSGVAKMYELVQPAVVEIEARRNGTAANTVDTSYGSGFFVSSDGLLVTDGHVVNGFNSIKLKSSDGEEFQATPVANDPANDLVLLKVNCASANTFKALQTEPDSSSLHMQQPLLIFGHPNGWDATYLSEGLTDGRATVRNITQNPDSGENINRHVIAIQAHGEEGNSGGPVIDENGKVIGIADKAAHSARGYHVFMTPIEPINAMLKQYRQSQEAL